MDQFGMDDMPQKEMEDFAKSMISHQNN